MPANRISGGALRKFDDAYNVFLQLGVADLAGYFDFSSLSPTM